ncbi:MAG: DNA-binding protein [Haliea sp.]|nr:DNA-binding protein [Haliea sp.]
MYLLDANTLIDAKRDYYPLDRIPEFWLWLVHQGQQGHIKIPIEIYEEFSDTVDKDGNKDALAEWADQDFVKKALLLEENADPDLVSRVIYEGYAADPTDEELIKIGRDPFLVSYALFQPGHRTIVTTEVSKPKQQRANRKIPDICATFGIPSINNFQLIRARNFRTNWDE